MTRSEQVLGGGEHFSPKRQLALTPERLDDSNSAISFETPKRRERGIISSVPVPSELLDFLDATLSYRDAQCDPTWVESRLWPWCRTTGWQRVRLVMRLAKVPVFLHKPKALRHGFAITATEERVTLGLVKKWLGHAKIEATEIYATPIVRQERALAKLLWKGVRPLNYRRSLKNKFVRSSDAQGRGQTWSATMAREYFSAFQVYP